MKIFENYNSAKQKYGVDLVDSLTKLGYRLNIFFLLAGLLRIMVLHKNELFVSSRNGRNTW